jgi:hypothetical protein
MANGQENEFLTMGIISPVFHVLYGIQYESTTLRVLIVPYDDKPEPMTRHRQMSQVPTPTLSH